MTEWGTPDIIMHSRKTQEFFRLQETFTEKRKAKEIPIELKLTNSSGSVVNVNLMHCFLI